VVDHDHLQLAAIRRVDDARSIHQRDAVLQRQPAAWHDDAHMPARNRNGNTGRHQRATSSG